MNMEKQLPEGWKWSVLGEVCEKVQAVKRKEVNPEEELLYLDIGGIDNITNKITSHKTFKWKDAPSRAQQIVRKSDILFSTVRTYMKNIAVVENQLYDGQIASSGFCVIRGKKDITDPKYLFYYSVSERFLRPLNELQTGTSYPAVRDKDIFSQPFLLPPLKVQEHIVSKIEELFSELDKGIETLKTAQQQLKTYRQSVLKWAFEGRLTSQWRKKNKRANSSEMLKAQIEDARNKYYLAQSASWEKAINVWEKVKEKSKKPSRPSKLVEPEVPSVDHELKKWDLPDEWLWTQIGTICFVTKLAGFEYTDYVKYDDTGDLAVLKAENAGPNGFKKTKYSKIHSNSVEMLTRSFLDGGELIIVFVGAGTGNVAAVPYDKKYFLGPNIGMARPYLKINAKFLEYQLQSELGKRMLTATIKAVAQPSLSMGTIRQTPIGFTTLDEQDQVVHEIESRLSVADKMEESIAESLQQAEALRQSILKSAFEGKLV